MAETYGVTGLSWTRLMAALEETTQIEEVRIFGSRALGRARNGSDIDLVLMGPQVTTKVALDLAGRLNEREPIPYQFDVLNGNQIDNAELKDHVRRVGRTIFRRASL